MSEYIPDTRPGSSAARGMLRRLVPIVLLGLVLFRVGAILADYATPGDDTDTVISTESTSTAEPASEPDGESGEAPSSGEDDAPVGDVRYVLVKIPGLNFRSEAKANAEVMRTLPKDTRLVLLGEQNGWYQVRDDDGVTGWVSSSPDYIEVVDE